MTGRIPRSKRPVAESYSAGTRQSVGSAVSERLYFSFSAPACWRPLFVWGKLPHILCNPTFENMQSEFPELADADTIFSVALNLSRTIPVWVPSTRSAHMSAVSQSLLLHPRNPSLLILGDFHLGRFFLVVPGLDFCSGMD